MKLGIGDVTRPLPKTIVKAMQNACEEMLNEKTFRGYGPYEGYEFLRSAIAKNYKMLKMNYSRHTKVTTLF